MRATTLAPRGCGDLENRMELDLASHLEALTHDLIQSGLWPEEAASTACEPDQTSFDPENHHARQSSDCVPEVTHFHQNRNGWSELLRFTPIAVRGFLNRRDFAPPHRN